SPLYELPKKVDPLAMRFVASYLTLAMIGVAVWLLRRRLPGVVAASIAFFVIVFPLLGIVQNGPQIAADRYTYNASMALAMLGGAALVRWPRRELGVATAALLVFWGCLTWSQTGIW